MTLSELLSPACVKIPLLATDKDGILREMVEHLAGAHGLADRKDEILASLAARECLMTTGIGRGIAIPHAELETPIRPVAAVGISPNGIEYVACDGKPVFVVFLLVVGRERSCERIETLSLLSRIVRQDRVREEIRGAATAEAVVEIFLREEERQRRPGHAATTPS